MNNIGISKNSIYFPSGVKQNLPVDKSEIADNDIVIPALTLSSIDTFVSNTRKSMMKRKLNQLFPNGELISHYIDMNRELGIDNLARLKFIKNKNSRIGGGYNFYKNTIRMNLDDLINSDTKIVGIKDGKETILTSSEALPLFVDKISANNFIKKHAKDGNLGYDKLVAKPVTVAEHKKFILQKIAHEVIHSQQHMIMRRSKAVGARAIIRAWDEYKPKNIFQRIKYEIKLYLDYKKSVWGKFESENSNQTNNKTVNEVAEKLLNAVKEYGAVNSEDYFQNFLEKDANERSADFIRQKYGDWN